MNRRDALKTLTAVAAGGAVPSAGAVVPLDAFDPRHSISRADIERVVMQGPQCVQFDPEIFAIARAFEEFIDTHVRLSSDPLVIVKRVDT